MNVKDSLWRTASFYSYRFSLVIRSLGVVEHFRTGLGKYRFWHTTNMEYAYKEHIMSDCTVVFVY